VAVLVLVVVVILAVLAVVVQSFKVGLLRQLL
jgi:hypothetical protein